MPGVLGLEAATDLLRTARQGSTGTPGAPGGEPVVVVDLDSDGDPASLDLHPSFPAVVVGIGSRSVGRQPLPGVDVAVTGAVDPPAPWVGTADPEEAVDHLSLMAKGSARAAVTLAHVLRIGTDGDLDRGLIAESLAYSTLQAGPEFAAWLEGRGPARIRPADGAPVVVVERSGARLDVTLNRARVRNAYNAAMRDQLCDALAVALVDPSVEQVHLHGAGPDFCSGGDLDEFGTLADPATAHLVRTTRSAARMLGALGDRVVAHLHGACVGAGIELPALAGRVVAAPGTWMQLPELSMGLVPGAGGTASLPRRIGRQRTAWMALSGRPVDVTTALAWGLVDQIGG